MTFYIYAHTSLYLGAPGSGGRVSGSHGGGGFSAPVGRVPRFGGIYLGVNTGDKFKFYCGTGIFGASMTVQARMPLFLPTNLPTDLAASLDSPDLFVRVKLAHATSGTPNSGRPSGNGRLYFAVLEMGNSDPLFYQDLGTVPLNIRKSSSAPNCYVEYKAAVEAETDSSVTYGLSQRGTEVWPER